MRRVAIVAMLAALGALYLYSAFKRDRSRHSPLASKVVSLRKVLHASLGIVLIICVLLLIYAAVMSSIPED